MHIICRVILKILSIKTDFMMVMYIIKKKFKYRITNSSQRFGFVKFEQSLIESKINTNVSIDMCNAMFFEWGLENK